MENTLRELATGNNTAEFWYDWFCKDSALESRAKDFVKLARAINNEAVLNMHVYLKNCCPVNGPLYDMIGMSKPNDDSNRIVIVKDCCWEKSKWAVYAGPKFEKPVFEGKTLRQVANYINTQYKES